MLIDMPKCVDCSKYYGCLHCDKHKNRIPEEIINGKNECSDFTKKAEQNK